MARSHLPTLSRYLRPHIRPLAWGTLALFGANALGTYLPWLLRRAVETLREDFSATQVGRYALEILVLATVMWGIRIASRLWLFGIGRAVESDLKQELFEHLLRLPPSYFGVRSAGDLIGVSTSDVENIRRMLGFALLSLINTVFAYALTLPTMLAIDPGLSLVAIAPYPLMLWITKSFSGRLQEEQATVQERLSDLNTLLQEDISGIVPIKTYAQETHEWEAFGEVNRQLLGANLALARTRNLLFPILGGIASFSLLALLWFGGEKLADPTSGFQVGDLLALIVLVERLIFPTALLGFTITVYQRGRVSIDRIEAVLQEPPAIDDRQTQAPAVPGPGHLAIRNLEFTYPGAKQPTLRGVTLEIPTGETLAIVGPVGAGKSTLAQALTRLVTVPPHTLFLDGIDVTELPVTYLRSRIAYVPQDSFLFSTTIRDNLRYGRPQAPDSAVEGAAARARIQGDILTFPQRYDTIVGERGITLSGGQRQRTALGRALLVDAPILLLDDALSSVDNQTAMEILAELPRHKTVIFITHKLAAAATADRIAVVENGRVVAVGCHETLLQTSPLYQKLWQQYELAEVTAA